MKKLCALVLAISLVTCFCGCGLLKKDVTPTDAPTSSVDSKPQDQLIIQTPAPPQVSSQTVVSSAPAKPAWKTAYEDYIRYEIDPAQYVEFALVYVDNDDVPELYMMGNCEATGEVMATYCNGRVESHSFGRLYGLQYIPRSGRFSHFNGNMGYYSLSLCTLNNGVVKTVIQGLQEEDLENFDGEGEIGYRYSLEGDPVTEEAFHKAIDSWFSQGGVCSMHSGAVSRQSMLNQLA